MVLFGYFSIELDCRRYMDRVQTLLLSYEAAHPCLTPVQRDFVLSYTSLCLDHLVARLSLLSPTNNRNRLPNQTRMFDLFLSDLEYLVMGTHQRFRYGHQPEVPHFIFTVISAWYLPARDIINA